MAQYRPCGRIVEEISHAYRDLLMRGITEKEYRYALDCARNYGPHLGFEG